MKRSELVFNIISIFVDSALIIIAASLAYFLRYRVESFLPQYPIIFDLSFAEFFRNSMIALPVILLFFSFNGLYTMTSTRGFREILYKVATSVSVALMLFVALYFFNPQIFPSRLIVLMSWIFTIVFVGVGRLTLLYLERSFLKRGIGLHRLVLVKAGDKDFGLQQKIATHPEFGYKIVAAIEGVGDVATQLEKIDAQIGIDEIMQANLDLDRDSNEKLLKFARDRGIVFNYVPSIIDSQKSNISAADLAGIPLLRLRGTPLEGWGKVVKRVYDVTFSTVFLVLLSPVFLLVALGIKLTSPGKVLYVQDRYGVKGEFKFFKFRSMHQHLSVGEDYGGADAQKEREKLWSQNARKGPFLKIKNDPRVTRFGKFIRRTKLDELPQLFNVFNGSMSLVGPRAHVTEEVNLYIKDYRRQFTLKPGITGLAQINQVNNPELSFEDEMRFNTFYIENWSIWLDFSIIFRTIIVLFQNATKPKDY